MVNSIHCTTGKRHTLKTVFTSVKLFFLVFLASTLMVAGCKTTDGVLAGPDFPPDRKLKQHERIAGGGFVSVFLNLLQPEGPEVSFELFSVELQAKNKKFSLLQEPLAVSSKEIESRQLFIARNSVSADNYYTLRFVLRDVSFAGRKLETGGSAGEIAVEMDLPRALNVREGDSRSLFVTWDVFSSMGEGAGFAPVMNTNLEAIPFLTDLLYVACPEIDTIYTIRTDKNWVISSLGVEGEPTYLAHDISSERLYVLTPKNSAIQVVDIGRNKIIDNIFIPLDNQPDFMTMSPDLQFAFVLDEQGKNLAKVDLLSGAIVNRVVLSFEPRYAVYLELQRALAVSSLDTNSVHLFAPDNLIDTGRVQVGNGPEGLLAWNNMLVVAESNANSVAIYDLYANQQQAQESVGYSPRRLLLNNEQIYIANHRDKSLTVTLPGQLSFSRKVYLDGIPLEMAVSDIRGWIYVGNGTKGGISLIESTSNRHSGFIDLKAIPSGIAVID